MGSNFEFKYVSSMEMQKVIQKVQQARRDREANLQLQNLKCITVRSSPAVAKTASVSSTSSSEDSSESFDSDSSFLETSSSDEEDVVPARTKSVPKTEHQVSHRAAHAKQQAQKPVKVAVQKFDHQLTISSIKKSQETIKGALLLVLEQLRNKELSGEELGSPRAEEKRKVRLAEYQRRIRRNYIYPFKTEVDKLHSYIQSEEHDIGKNTNKQSALRSVGKVLNAALQAFQAHRKQTLSRRDFLATLSTLTSILENVSRLEAVFVQLDVQNEDLVSLCHAISKELNAAYIEAENLEIQYQMPDPPKVLATKSKKRLGPKKAASKPKTIKKKLSVMTSQSFTTKVTSPIIEQQCKDVSTGTEPFVPLAELSTKLQTMSLKPTNVRFVMMKHNDIGGVSEAAAQTLDESGLNVEKQTQTADQAVILDEGQSHCIEQLIAEALKGEMSGDMDYLTQIIEQVINQEFV